MAKTNLTQRDKSKLETRQRLMAAGLELFTQRGYTNTRAADIAARAGVAVGTLYLHFGDKEGLLHALAEATINRLYDHVEKLYLREIDSSEELARTHIAALVDFVEENRPAVRFLLGAEVSDLPGISQALELAIGQVEGMLRRGQTAGLYRPDINPRLAARAEAGMNLGLLSWWSAHPGEATRNEIIDTLAKMRMSGLHAAPTKQE